MKKHHKECRLELNKEEIKSKLQRPPQVVKGKTRECAYLCDFILLTKLSIKDLTIGFEDNGVYF